MGIKKGFTLAETLITLSILGIVAAITISRIINNAKNAINMAKLKKTYSWLTNSIDESLAANMCNNLTCVIEKNNKTVGNPSYEMQMDNLKVFFPEIQPNDNYKCIPPKYIH